MAPGNDTFTSIEAQLSFDLRDKSGTREITALHRHQSDGADDIYFIHRPPVLGDDEEKIAAVLASPPLQQEPLRVEDQASESRLMPFLIRPIPAHAAGPSVPWLKPDQEAVSWLSLFYGKSYLDIHLIDIHVGRKLTSQTWSSWPSSLSSQPHMSSLALQPSPPSSLTSSSSLGSGPLRFITIFDTKLKTSFIGAPNSCR